MTSKSQTHIPWNDGTARDIQDALKELLPDYLDDSQYWTARSLHVLQALLPPLVWLRDHNRLPTELNTETFLRYTKTLNVFRLALSLERNPEIPDEVSKPLIKFLDFCGPWRVHAKPQSFRTFEEEENLTDAIKQYVFSVQSLQAGLETLLERNAEVSPPSQADLSALQSRV